MKPQTNQLGPMLSTADAVIGAAVITIVFASGGVWLDSKLHTAPWLALLATFSGMILGMVRMVMKASQGMHLPPSPKAGSMPAPLPDDWKDKG